MTPTEIFDLYDRLFDFEFYVLDSVQDAKLHNITKGNTFVRDLAIPEGVWVSDTTALVLTKTQVFVLLAEGYLKPHNSPVKLTTRVVHSMSKPAWNVIGTKLGSKFKIAQVPYVDASPESKKEARLHALFISFSFNSQR